MLTLIIMVLKLEGEGEGMCSDVMLLGEREGQRPLIIYM